MTNLIEIEAYSDPHTPIDDYVPFTAEELKGWFAITDADLRLLDDNGYIWQYEVWDDMAYGERPEGEPMAYLYLPHLSRYPVSVSEALTEIRNGVFDRVNTARRERFIRKKECEAWKRDRDNGQALIDSVTYGMAGFQSVSIIDMIKAPKPRRHQTDNMFTCDREWELELFAGTRILQRGHIGGWRVVLLRGIGYSFEGIWWHPDTPRRHIPVVLGRIR